MVSTSNIRANTFLIQGRYPEEGYGWIESLSVFWYVCLTLKGAQRRKLPCSPPGSNLCTFLCQLDLMDQEEVTSFLKYFVNIYMRIIFIWMLLLGDRSLLEYVLFCNQGDLMRTYRSVMHSAEKKIVLFFWMNKIVISGFWEMCSCTKDSRHSDRIISLIQKRGAASRFHRTCTVVHADISLVFHLPTPLLVQSLRLL